MRFVRESADSPHGSTKRRGAQGRRLARNGKVSEEGRRSRDRQDARHRHRQVASFGRDADSAPGRALGETRPASALGHFSENNPLQKNRNHAMLSESQEIKASVARRAREGESMNGRNEKKGRLRDNRPGVAGKPGRFLIFFARNPLKSPDSEK